MSSLRKILTRLRGTNFCTTSARLAPSFVRQPNGHECTQIVRNAPKRHFRVQWGGLGAFVVTKFHKATKRSRMHPNSTKRIKTSVYGGMGWIGCVCCEKVPTQLRGTNFCTTSARFAQSFVRQLNVPKCTQMV